MKKIRFYHWWAYRLYRWLWNPILEERPEMVKAMRDWNQSWLQHRAREVNQRKLSHWD